MKNQFRIVLAVLVHFGYTTLPALAHPGSGIVVDPQGRVYFSEAGDIDAHLPGAIWQIDAQGKLTRLQEGGAHYLTLDAHRGFAPTNLARWFGERVTPWLQRADTPDAALIQADGQPIAMCGDGSLYFAKGNLQVTRLSSDGTLTTMAPAQEQTERLGGVKGLAFGPDDSLYVACPSAVLKVTTNGTVSTTVHPITVPDCALESPSNTSDSYSPGLRGLAVDAHGTVYATATVCRAVVKITSDGRVSVVLRSEAPWSPTGVAIRDEEVYMLEYQHANSARREEWLPRVRKMARDGKVTTLVSLPTAQGRPAAPPQR